MPSPGHGRLVQLRFETELTAEEYVSREEWKNASFPPCLKGHCACDCGLMRHGTYGRKTPIPMRVARFDCRDCQTTISRLPDFAAARRRGSLQEIEDAMIVLAEAPSLWAAARRLFPHRDELSNGIRDLLGAFMAVSVFLEAVVTLRPDLFRGCPADLVSMRAALGTETLLVDLRREMTSQLQFLPPPVGFRPPGTGEKSPTGPPTLFEPCSGAADRGRWGRPAHRSPE